MKKFILKFIYVFFVGLLGISICEFLGIIKKDLFALPIWAEITLLFVCFLICIFVFIKFFKKKKEFNSIFDSLYVLIFFGLAVASQFEWINFKPLSPFVKGFGCGVLLILFLISILALPSFFRLINKDNINH